MTNYSAKDLITRSCRQLWYFSMLPKPTVLRKKAPSQRMLDGTDFQNMIISNYFPNCHSEMCGVFEYKDNAVFFSNDICYPNKIIEVKWVDESEPVPDWYLQNSILQCALYSSFIRSGCTLLHTAKFSVKGGSKSRVIEIDKEVPYYLRFGGDTYAVEVLDPEPFLDYIRKKIDSISSKIEAARFDFKYKHKEFQLLGEYFQYRKLSESESKLLQEST